MIQFFCRCGHPFEVPDDQAGSLIQCPKCSLLRDVPSISDLKGIGDDGLYKLDEEGLPPAEPHRMTELHEVYGSEKLDYSGEEKDFRQGMDDLIDVGAEEVPLELFNEVLPGAPKYDPETGELVRPIDLKDDLKFKAPVAAIPMAKPALNYASKGTSAELREVNAFDALAMLFTPQNLVVMFFVFLMHILNQVVLIPTMVGFFILVPVLFGLNALIVSHYGCVIEEIGPDNRDELPRPLRHLEWHEDLWGPFVNCAFAWLFSFWPVGLVAWSHMPPQSRWLIEIGLFLAGMIIFPAALLTSCTSGVWLNMRPDRVFDVMRICGPKYLIAVVLWVITFALYTFGQYAALSRVIGMFTRGGTSTWIRWTSSYGALMVAVASAHYFCWYLGLLYRRYQPEFPWILQSHSMNPMERMQWDQTRRAEREARLAMKNKKAHG